MTYEHADANDVAVHAHHDEHQDFGTVTPKPVVVRVRALVLQIACRRTKAVPIKAQDWSNWSWANAPPRRAA
jgi:hypothetical protein